MKRVFSFLQRHSNKSMFIGLHVFAAAAFFFPATTAAITLCVVCYVLRMFGITAGYHRLLSHKAFKARRWVQFTFAFLGCSAFQKGPLWWAARHRDHHKHSDDPEDVHSPVQKGLWWSHIGWIMVRRYTGTNMARIADFAKYPELRWLNRWFYVPPIVYGTTFFLIGGWPLLLWGYFISTVLLWHGTFTINSLAHRFGQRRFETRDGSRNNLWLALLTFGEGWHNNHHFFPGSARQGFRWWEIDLTYYGLRAMAMLRLVHGLKPVPAWVAARARGG